MGAPSLASVLAAEKDELIRRWRERIRGTIDPAGASAAEILDSLPAFLDELANYLQTRREETPDEATGKARALAAVHGTKRFHAGFSLGAVIREYGVLRDCVLDLIRDHDLEIEIDELKAVLKGLNTGVVIAAEQFTRERDQAIERQSREHFGFIAHELRNPLGSALLAAQVLQRRSGTEEDVTFKRLLRNLSVLSHLIDNSLVSVQAREAGDHHHGLDIREVSLGEIVEGARTEIDGDAEEKRLRIVLDGDARIRADPRLVRSAITNLIRNAVKYTQEGGRIEVRIRVGEQLASVEVEDECGGLPAGKTEELFTPFVQRGADRTGFGLGLAITKDAVQAHQGNVQVSNLPGKGCVFMLSFPVGGPAD